MLHSVCVMVMWVFDATNSLRCFNDAVIYCGLESEGIVLQNYDFTAWN